MRSTSRRRNIQAVSLQCAYTSDERINRVCRQTMTLPFIPADVIADEFQTLHTASDDLRLAQHLQYMERLLPGQSSVSRCGPTTTSRAATSTYTSSFSCCTQKLHLYSLTRLLSEGHAMRLQRKSFAALHSRLSEYWDKYVAGTCSVYRVLRACSHLCILHQRHFGTEVS